MAAFTLSSTQFQLAAGSKLAVKKRATAPRAAARRSVVVAAGPKRVMIAGAPASGKGTQCELIVEKYGLVHISAGDLLRAAVKEGTPAGLEAKEYMDRGDLVPDSCVVSMVVDALDTPDAKEKGWLLDGYPRSASQADAIAKEGIEPDTFLLLDVPDEMLIERVVGRRLDPETGKIYHLKFSPLRRTSSTASPSAATTPRRRRRTASRCTTPTSRRSSASTRTSSRRSTVTAPSRRCSTTSAASSTRCDSSIRTVDATGNAGRREGASACAGSRRDTGRYPSHIRARRS